MRRKNHVRFGGGPTEQGQPTDWYLAGGLPYPTAPLALETYTSAARSAETDPCDRGMAGIPRRR
jgi:hypothetical protein